jgi:hypothetical protein
LEEESQPCNSNSVLHSICPSIRTNTKETRAAQKGNSQLNTDCNLPTQPKDKLLAPKMKTKTVLPIHALPRQHLLRLQKARQKGVDPQPLKRLFS